MKAKIVLMLTWFLLLITLYSLQAQHEGGKGDGYSSGRYLGTLNGVKLSKIYSGGLADGSSHHRYSGRLSGVATGDRYLGGDGDGYSGAGFIGYLGGESIATMYAGGVGDGFDHKLISLPLHAVPLPVTLLSFDAYPENEFVLIRWETETEFNHHFFTVERSLDGLSFARLKDVPGAGISLERKSYREIDTHPAPGVSYYRLKSTDFDETFSYSQVVAVNMPLVESRNLLVFPNPNSGQTINLRLTGPETSEALAVSIVDLNGRTLTSSRTIMNGNELFFELTPNEALPKGSYLLKVRGMGWQMNKLLVIQ